MHYKKFQNCQNPTYQFLYFDRDPQTTHTEASTQLVNE